MPSQPADPLDNDATRECSDNKESRRAMIRAALVTAGAWALTGCAGQRTARSNTPSQPYPSTTSTTTTRPTTTANANTASTAQSNAAAKSALERWKAMRAPAAGLPAGAITRNAWANGAPVPSLADPMLPIDRITIHHDGMSVFTSTSKSAAQSRLELIRKAHRNKGWADIGYHFVIDPAGRVYQGRPLTLQGAHVARQNEGNVGIMLLGNYMEQRPTGDAIVSLNALLLDRMRAHRVAPRNVRTHRELASTLCPGVNLQREINNMRARGGILS